MVEKTMEIKDVLPVVMGLIQKMERTSARQREQAREILHLQRVVEDMARRIGHLEDDMSGADEDEDEDEDDSAADSAIVEILGKMLEERPAPPPAPARTAFKRYVAKRQQQPDIDAAIKMDAEKHE